MILPSKTALNASLFGEIQFDFQLNVLSPLSLEMAWSGPCIFQSNTDSALEGSRPLTLYAWRVCLSLILR